MIFVALSLEVTDIFNCRFFLNRFPACFNLSVLLFVVTPCFVVQLQPCMEWIPIKKKSIGHFSIGGSNIINFSSRNTDISLVIERPQRLRPSTQTLKSSSTSCFEYFAIIKFSKFCKNVKCSCGSWPAYRLLYL